MDTLARPLPRSVTSENRLLGRLTASHPEFLSSLERVRLSLGDELEKPNDPIGHVYFPEGGLVSVIATGPRDKKIEVGMIGYEGMTGLSLVLGVERPANLLLVQSPGSALRISRSDFLKSLEIPELRRLWSRYAHVQLAQTSQTGLTNGTGTLRERLARWILMWQDRIREPAFQVTHQYVSLLLGVRRAGVTDALHQLEGASLIKANRNLITVLNRDGLIAAANGFYGVAEEIHDRVMG
jgi:CRP-like cAMP-binding protein